MVNIRCVWAKLVLLLTAASLLLFVRSSAQLTSEEEGVDTTSPEIVTTDWGPESNGLQLRVTSGKTYNYLDAISLSLRIRAVDGSNVTSIFGRDGNMGGPYVKLRLVDLETGLSRDFDTVATLSSPYKEGDTVSTNHSELNLDVTYHVAGVPDKINPEYEAYHRDNRKSLFEWKTAWDSASTRPPISGLPAGRYSARVEILIAPGEEDSWHGLLISPQFDLAVSDNTAKPDTVSFVFPRRLALQRGPILCSDTSSFDTISVVIAPHYVTSYTIAGNVSMAYLPGLPCPPAILFGPDELRPYVPASGVTLQLPEGPVFEDGEAIMRFKYELSQLFYTPGKRHRRARAQLREEVLWTGSIETIITRSEYESMKVPELELYDHHTLLIPHKVYLREGRTVEFDKDSLLPLGVQVSKGSGFLTTVTKENQIVHRYSGLPVSPLVELPGRIASNSRVSINVSIYEQAPTSDLTLADTLREDDKVWSGDFILTNVGDAFEIALEEKREAPVIPLYRRYEIPRSLILTDGLEVYGDTTNPIIVELEKLPDDVVLGYLQCRSERTDCDEFNELIPTDFRGALASLRFPTIDKDSITCELSLYNARRRDGGFWFSVGSSLGCPKLWKKTYRIPVTEKQAKKINKQVRALYKARGIPYDSRRRR